MSLGPVTPHTPAALIDALEVTAGNVAAAARYLGIQRRCMFRTLRRHGIRIAHRHPLVIERFPPQDTTS